jgi:hypothetical protein
MMISKIKYNNQEEEQKEVYLSTLDAPSSPCFIKLCIASGVKLPVLPPV